MGSKNTSSGAICSCKILKSVYSIQVKTTFCFTGLYLQENGVHSLVDFSPYSSKNGQLNLGEMFHYQVCRHQSENVVFKRSFFDVVSGQPLLVLHPETIFYKPATVILGKLEPGSIARAC